MRSGRKAASELPLAIALQTPDRLEPQRRLGPALRSLGSAAYFRQAMIPETTFMVSITSRTGIVSMPASATG